MIDFQKIAQTPPPALAEAAATEADRDHFDVTFRLPYLAHESDLIRMFLAIGDRYGFQADQMAAFLLWSGKKLIYVAAKDDQPDAHIDEWIAQMLRTLHAGRKRRD